MATTVWTVDFYFDFVSPYSYFAWLEARPRCMGAGVRLVPRPVVLAALLDSGGQPGPAEIPNKRAYLIRETLRYAGRRNIAFTFPMPHPFNPITALRLSLPEVAGSNQERIINALWQAGWAQGRDLSNCETLATILDDLGLDGESMIHTASAPGIKHMLRTQTDQAIQRGVFGVPSFYVNGELFWGNDRVDDLCEYLAGDDPLDRELLKELLARPLGVERSRSG